ncbi:NEDD4 family-interacting protein 1 [Carlito syrichta]|uniref:NEDD4 family-interacting protein 1 n=1 Tax=Carlito syrichta TaxID=1868482 RepID=A0A3Q0EF95_CARSF|nr:NEDD4 family-interacting protein 1 [Carlito syrichta]
MGADPSLSLADPTCGHGRQGVDGNRSSAAGHRDQSAAKAQAPWGRRPASRAVAPSCARRPGWGEHLQNDEETGVPEQAVGDAPPPYSSISAENTAYFDYKDESGFPKPPSYNVATTLPSYDEAERTKAEATIPLVPGRDEDFVGRDDFDDADQLRIGNDGIFMLTFFMAFLFNWIGFFLSFCLTTSAAGRYGAISGFGLSLIKWILIVRFSTYFPGYFDGQYWLWWVFLVLEDLSIMQKFGRCQKHSQISPGPEFSLFTKDVFWQRPSCVYEFSLKKQENTCRK